MSDPGKRFKFALSFSGEHRAFVAQVAEELSVVVGQDSVLYDKYHEPELARLNLDIHLPNLYRTESELVAIFLCAEYATKRWCKLEWRFIRQMIVSSEEDRIMLLSFDEVGEIPELGILSGDAYISIGQRLPQEIAALILRRAERQAPTVDRRNRRDRGNLPPLTCFFGRDGDLKKIADALQPDVRTWLVLIVGPGGIGKTTLAIRAAELSAEVDYPRIVFVSAKAQELECDGVHPIHDFRVSSYLEMLNTIARELGDRDLAKLDEKDRPLALQQLQRERPRLLVVDNVESMEDIDRRRVVEYLRRLPHGTKAIVTSRDWIDLPAERISLGQLAWEDAALLLDELARNSRQLAKTSETDRLALYTHTGGNPLILQWVAGHLGWGGRCQNLNEALSLLNESPEGDEALEFIFGDLLTAFSPEEVRLLAALSHFSQPIEPQYISKVANVPALRAQAGLEALFGRAIVTKDSSRGFALMPLVAGFMSRKRAAQVRNAGERLADHAYTLVIENRSPEKEYFERLEGGWLQIEAGLQILVRGQNDRLQRVCDALNDFLEETARWDELLFLSDSAEKKALETADFKSAGMRAYRIGWIHNLRGQGEEVLVAADRAVKHWDKARAGIWEKTLTSYLRGIGFRLKELYPEALEAFVRALESYRSMGDDGPASGTLNEIGEVQRLMKDYPNAQRHFEEALQIARNIDSPEAIAACLGRLAKLALDRGLSGKAESLALDALPRAVELGRQDLIAEDCYCLVKALEQEGRLKDPEALGYCRWAVRIKRKLRLPDLDDAEALLRKCEDAANGDSSPDPA
jgi:tetratricopeptide (TPR) repeat protein